MGVAYARGGAGTVPSPAQREPPRHGNHTAQELHDYTADIEEGVLEGKQHAAAELVTESARAQSYYSSKQVQEKL